MRKKNASAPASGAKTGDAVWEVGGSLSLDFRRPGTGEPRRRELIVGGGARAALAQMDALQFLRALPDQGVDLLIADPAYSGMNEHLKLGKGRIVGEYKLKGRGGRWFEEFRDTEENYAAFLKECHRVLKNGSHLYLMFDSYSMLTLGPLVREVFALKNVLVWDKMHIGMGHYFRRRSEFILFAVKGRRPLTGRNFPDILKVKRLHKAAYPTQKPVALFETLVDASLGKGDAGAVVCDPFFGSGAAALAAFKRGFSFVGADIAPKALELAGGRLKAWAEHQTDPLEKNPKN